MSQTSWPHWGFPLSLSVFTSSIPGFFLSFSPFVFSRSFSVFCLFTHLHIVYLTVFSLSVSTPPPPNGWRLKNWLTGEVCLHAIGEHKKRAVTALGSLSWPPCNKHSPQLLVCFLSPNLGLRTCITVFLRLYSERSRKKSFKEIKQEIRNWHNKRWKIDFSVPYSFI